MTNAQNIGVHDAIVARSTAAPVAIVVDKDVPLPRKGCRGRKLGEKQRHWNYRYPWKRMNIGDSFVVPADRELRSLQRGMAGAIANRQRTAPAERYTTRIVVEKGKPVCRVWRGE